MALDARRLDRLAAALRGAPDRAGALAYCLRVAQSLVPDRRFRDGVLRLLVELLFLVRVLLVRRKSIQAIP